MRAFCELNDDGTRIRVFFQYDAQAKDRIKAEIPGWRFHGKDDPAAAEDGPHWSVPAQLTAARKLRDIFGQHLTLGNAVRAWGRDEAQRERNLGTLSVADDAELKRVPEVAPVIMRIIAGEPIPEFGLSKKHPLSRKRPARPYQRADIAMMAMANVINANQPGCMAWDTVVEINRGGRSHRTGKTYKLTIAQLYARFNGRDATNYNFDRSQPTLIRCRTSDGCIRLTELKAAYDSGVKQTYKVTTTTGRSVRATAEHPFLTPGGWRKLEELQSGDKVYVDAGRPVASGAKPKKIGDKEIHLRHHPCARKAVKVVPYHHIVVEAAMNSMTTEEFITAVRGSPKYSKRGRTPEGFSRLKFLPAGTVVHHIDGDHSNNDLHNLQVVSNQAEHGRIHGLWQNATSTTTTEIIDSVVEDERTRTYDLELVDAPHNFLANGFVVHNTGKTLEALGALVEAELEDGPHLVCAPRTSLVNTWKVEIERIFPNHPVFTSEDPAERRRQVDKGLQLAVQGKPCWILVIFDDLRVKKVATDKDTPEKREAAAREPLYARKDHKGSVYHYQNERHKRLVAVHWNSFNIDEFHKAGLNNPMSLFTLGTDMVKSKRNWRMSGTPMGGKPIHLFPVLRSIEPKQFSSKWRWANQWLEVTNNGWGNKIGGIKPGLEEDFYNAHKTVMVRRMKREALPGLPPKIQEIVMCEMTAKQKEQYEQFDLDAEVRISGESGDKLVVGDCILAEYTRLKQFANAYCELNARGEVCPTEESGKLPYLLDKLDEFGIRRHDPEPGARAIVASQSLRMVEMVHKWLIKHGIPNDMLTGNTKDSAPIIKRFQDLDDERPYVIVMTTQTGGVSLNLESANSVHILDESWNPDEEEQLEDRGDRGTRQTPLVCVYYRTRDSVQEYIAEVAEDKKITNATALDIYRQIQKLAQQKKARGGERVAA